MNVAQKKYRPNPRSKANLLSILCFGYTFEMFKTGCKKGLEVRDLYNPLGEDRSSVLGDRLKRNWEAQLTKARPSLLKAIVATFWYQFLIAGLMIGIHDIVMKVFQVYMLEGLLNYFRTDSDCTRNEAMWYAGLLSLMNFMTLIVLNHYNLRTHQIGLQGRVSTSALIYEKALKLRYNGCTTPGKLVNLLSNDVSRFDYVPIYLHQMCSAAVSTVVFSIILYRQSGVAGIMGVLAILLLLPVHRFLGRLAAKYRMETSSRTDERVRLMDELISGIRVIKMFTWEKPLEKIIKSARRTEMKYISRASYVRALFMIINVLNLQIAICVALVTMIVTTTPLTAVKVYVIISYYNMLMKNMGSIFSRGFSETAELYVGIEKIQNFLMAEEHDENETEDGNRNWPRKSLDDFKAVVELSNLTVKWHSSPDDMALVDISLKVPEAFLLGILGPVGSGKSTLLHTIMGDLEIVSGSMKVGGTISYASQDPWIFCATVRQNILFGQKFDRIRYREVIQACSLDEDFEQLENGDLTIVGDRGASLSGGQKARINLARAVYRDADIYLLDDPLSAVDIHVSKHLYQECIKTFLAKKIRILVTHQVHHLKDVDQIVILKDGRIENGWTNSKMDRSQHESIGTKQDVHVVSPSSLEEEESLMMKRRAVGLECPRGIFHSMKIQTKNEKGFKETLSPINEEASSKGKVKGFLLLKYLNTDKSVCFAGFILFLLIIFYTIGVGRSYFITYWLNIEEFRRPEDWSTATMLSIYGGFFLTSLIVLVSSTFLFFTLTLGSSNKFHSMMINSVLSAPVSFFDNNPGGRILNRFSKDLGLVDDFLPRIILDFLQIAFYMAGGIILLIIVDPYVMLMIAFLGMVFGFLKYVYSSSANDLRRLDGITKSPVFTHVKATLEGITTIRASGVEDILKEEFDTHQDLHSGAFYMFISARAAFGFYLDIVSSIFLAVLTFSFLLFERSTGMTGAEVGLIISEATSITSLMQWTMTVTAEVGYQLMSVERILEYKGLPNEIQPDIPESVPACWPSEGGIVLEKLRLRYSDGGPLVLKNINLIIKPKEKIGIVGRTGAGKSSLISAFFRLSPVEGIMEIDRQDTSSISLDVLRSKISIIPQDPVLFSGTLRYNLDPSEEHTDEELYKVIEDVKLKDPLNILNRLENRVMEKGSNYSVGQRQLICLGRAILKNNRILLLDEATANVDDETDAMIQDTIRKKFFDCTVVTVAHRLISIMDSDKVLVMDNGSVAEFNNPHLLLQNTSGLFYKMVTESDISEQLHEIAANHYGKVLHIQNG